MPLMVNISPYVPYYHHNPLKQCTIEDVGIMLLLDLFVVTSLLLGLIALYILPK